MTWLDDIQDAAYTSPGGVRFTYSYENVTKEIDKKTAGFTFPDADGTHVQDLGKSGYRYPLRMFFHGPNYNTEAKAFEAALLEPGTGKLDHPIYGTVNVVPFGTIKRRDDLKTAANQCIVEVVFWEQTALVYPATQAEPASVVLEAVKEYNVAASAEFAETIITETVTALVTLENNVLALVDVVESGLETIAETQENVKKQFDSIVSSINNGIDILVQEPLTLAFQATQLIQAPARALTSIKARLSAYRNLAELLILGEDSVSETANKFRTDDLYVSSYVTGSIVSTVNNQFVTKTEALEAAEEVLEQFEQVVVWRDANLEALELIDTGGAYQKLQEAVAVTVGFLVQISFTLKQERRIVLDRARAIVELAGELYGSIDPELDFFILSNDLSGSEIIELPAGREVVYYV